MMQAAWRNDWLVHENATYNTRALLWIDAISPRERRRMADEK